MQLKTGMVLTGLSALSYLGYSPFNPGKLQVSMARGTNTISYQNKYEINVMSKDMLEYKTQISSGIKHYSLARLFVELSRFSMEATIKSQIMKKIIKVLIPEEVNKIYLKIKKNTRGLNFDHVEKYLEDSYFGFSDLILENPISADDYIREYFLAILGDNDVPVLLKGGSAVELFIDVKRSTKDIDLLSGEDGIENTMKILTNPKAPLYIKLTEKNKETINKKRISKLSLQLHSISTNLNNFLKGDKAREGNKLEITFNKSLDDENIQDVINNYKLSKQPLKLIKKKSVITFSKEMILAEKYHAIISKPSVTKRGKDLFDITQIYSDDLNWKKVSKWLFRRFETNRHNPLSKADGINWIKKHQTEPLTKIKENWVDAEKMYDSISQSFDAALKIYQKITDKVLKEN